MDPELFTKDDTCEAVDGDWNMSLCDDSIWLASRRSVSGVTGPDMTNSKRQRTRGLHTERQRLCDCVQIMSLEPERILG